MKTLKLVVVATLTLTLLVGLILVLAVYAQGSEEEELKDAGEDVGAAGLVSPVPAGYGRIYWFTSVANDDTAPDQIATSVHCTNYGSENTSVQVVLYSYSGTPYTGTDTILPNRTSTFSSQPTAVYFDDINISAPAIYQGSGQVIATRPTIICAAQLLDPIHDQPVFMVDLDLYRP